MAGGRRFAIELGRRTWAGTYARRLGENDIFVLGDSTRAGLERWAIDRSALMLDASHVDALTVARGARRLILKRKADAGVHGKLAKVLEVLSEARALGVVHLGGPHAEEGLNGGELRVTVDRRTPSYRIAIGAEGVWGGARSSTRGAPASMPTFALDERQVRALLDLDFSAD